jgi:hypothetical protein
LLIKKHDEHEVEGYDIDQYDSSVLTKRSMDEIAGDAGSAEWRSRPAGHGRVKAAWLSDAVAKYDKKKAAEKEQSAGSATSMGADKTTGKASTRTKRTKKAEPVDIREASEKKTAKTKKLKSA